MYSSLLLCFFFFNDTATTEIYTLSLHDALPISVSAAAASAATAHRFGPTCRRCSRWPSAPAAPAGDRKSTRLNSSHVAISYAVFCLKKKKKEKTLHADRPDDYHVTFVARTARYT